MPPIQPQRTFGSVLGQGIGRFGNALEDLGAIRRGQNPDVLREQSRALELKILQEKLKTLEALEGTGALVQLGPEERVSLLDRLLPNMDPIIKQSVAQNPESLRALFSKDLDPATAKALTLSIFQGRLNPRQAVGAAADLLETAKAQREAASNRRLIGVLNTLEDDPSDPTTVNVYRAIRSGLGQSGFKVEDLAGIKPNLEASVTGEAGAIKTGLETQARVLSTARAKEQPVFEGGPSIREMEFKEKVQAKALPDFEQLAAMASLGYTPRDMADPKKAQEVLAKLSEVKNRVTVNVPKTPPAGLIQDVNSVKLAARRITRVLDRFDPSFVGLIGRLKGLSTKLSDLPLIPAFKDRQRFVADLATVTNDVKKSLLGSARSVPELVDVAKFLPDPDEDFSVAQLTTKLAAFGEGLIDVLTILPSTLKQHNLVAEDLSPFIIELRKSLKKLEGNLSDDEILEGLRRGPK